MRQYVRLLVPVLLALAPIRADAQEPETSRVTLDYEFFKGKVQPILAAKRPGLTRCVTCHKEFPPATAFHMAPPGPDGNWTEEQSRQNFQLVSRRVVPGNIARSRLLVHPLRTEAGGDRFHFGGKHFMSPVDPEWQTLKDWVMGKKLGS